MPIDPDTLASFAGAYAKGMTSIRGRRVQRLLKREFGGADVVVLAQLGSGAPAVLGVSASGAALCATNGKGPQVSVVKWSHGSAVAHETRFDLLKDSLPALGTEASALARLRQELRLRVPAGSVPPAAGPWVAKALEALA